MLDKKINTHTHTRARTHTNYGENCFLQLNSAKKSCVSIFGDFGEKLHLCLESCVCLCVCVCVCLCVVGGCGGRVVPPVAVIGLLAPNPHHATPSHGWSAD